MHVWLLDTSTNFLRITVMTLLNKLTIKSEKNETDWGIFNGGKEEHEW